MAFARSDAGAPTLSGSARRGIQAREDHRESRRRTPLVGTFPDGKSALMLSRRDSAHRLDKWRKRPYLVM